MKYLILYIFFFTFQISLFANDSTIMSCKYRLTKQLDSTNSLVKFNDIMVLSISNNSTLYYSYLKQFGSRQMDKDIQTQKEGSVVMGNTVSIDGSKKKGSYYLQNESEIIHIDLLNKRTNVSDQLMLTTYKYSEPLKTPEWIIGRGNQIILEQKCQTATTTFKGRKYTAWFAPSIPLPYGPWLFNGLPGLILKLTDDKGQFLFECIELNTAAGTTKVFKPYLNTQEINKRKLQEYKKLLAQNPMAFMQSVEGKTVTTKDAQGNIIINPRPNKPYNPIDLSK